MSTLPKLYSVWAAAAIIVLNAALLGWGALKDASFLSPDMFAGVNAVLGALVIFARALKQPDVDDA